MVIGKMVLQLFFADSVLGERVLGERVLEPCGRVSPCGRVERQVGSFRFCDTCGVRVG